MRLWRWFQVGGLLATFVACDGQLGCLSCGDAFDYPDPPPPGGEILHQVTVAELEERGVEFIASHLSAVLRHNLPTRTAGGIERAIVYLPEAQIGSAVSLTIRDGCIGDDPPEACPPRFDDNDDTVGPTFRSKIELNLDTIDDAVDAVFLPGAGDVPDRVRISLYDVDVFVDMALVIEAAGGNATCLIHDDQVDLPAVHIERLRFEVSLDVDAQHHFVGDVSSVEIDMGFFDDASLLNLSVSPCNGGACDDPTCHDGWTDFECPGLCVVGDFVFETAEFLADILSPVLELFAPILVEPALQAVLNGVDGAPLAVSGQFDVGTLFNDSSLAGLLLDPTELSFGALPGEPAFAISGPAAGRGLGLLLDAGMAGDASSCVPTLSPPDYDNFTGLLPSYDGTVAVSDPVSGEQHQETYHLALSLSSGMLQQAGFAFYELGGLCLVLTPDRVRDMSSGAFEPTLGTLGLFAPGLLDLGPPDAPVLFVVHPTASPHFSLGTGEPTPEGPIDPHLHVDFGEVGLSLFVEIDGALVRLATVAGDVTLAMSLVRTQDNTLALGLDELAISNLVQVYSEIAGATDFAGIAEVMLNLAFGGLIEKVSGFNLDLAPFVSDMLGGAPVFARINTVKRDGGSRDGYLTVYLTFCDEDDLADPQHPPCYSPPAPIAATIAPHAAPPSAGRMRVSVDPSRLYRVGVDGTALSGLQPARDGQLVVKSPLLRLPGAHRVTVESQDPARYWQAPRRDVLEAVVERPGSD